jgi:membrane fusion protein, multidrug efflux system
MRGRALALAAVWIALTGLVPSRAQMPSSGPPAVGVVQAKRMPITETNDFIGRVEAVNHVALVARVTAFLEQRLFTEGAEVKKGDVLYKLEQGPFQADVMAKQASVQQANALLANNNITLRRAQSLLNTPAGQRSAVDDALAQQRSQAAQLLAAQANLATSQINLSYTQITAPIDGKISRTAVTEGNVVTPSSGTLATIVSQDPMYVVFPIPSRTAIDLQRRYTGKGGFSAVEVKLRLPGGRLYGATGKFDYIDPTVSTNTDTLTARAVFANPLAPGAKPGEPGNRTLIDGEFVTVQVQGVEPIEVLGVPRAAILSDQEGDFVYTVGPGNKVEQKRVHLGQSTPQTAAIVSGLNEGDTVIVEGIQKVRPGVTVQPGPASPGPTASPETLQGGH